MKKTTRDAIVMFAIMLISAVTYLVIIPSQIKALSTVGFSNRTFPQFTMAVIFIAAAAGLVESLLKGKKGTDADTVQKTEGSAGWRNRLLPLLGFLTILAYAFLFWFISTRWRGYGFPVATAVFIPAFLALLRCRNWRYYVAAYSFATIMYLIFRFILKVILR